MPHRICLLLLLLLLLLPTLAGAQSLDVPPPEKSGNPKLSSPLNDLAAAAKISAKRVGDEDESSPLLRDDGRVVVTLVPEPGKPASSIEKEPLLELGGVFVKESSHLLQMALPPAALTEASQVAGVSFIRRPIHPAPQTSVSEGVYLIGASLSHAQNVHGDAVHVAVVDGGFEGALDAYIAGELPNCTTISFADGPYDESGSSNHGTACAEIVYDVAPGADMSLVRVSHLLSAENAIDWCIANGVDIISHSLGAPSTGMGDGKGPSAYLANHAASSGILFVDAAGNSHDGQVYNGTWTDANASGWHEFAPGNELLLLKGVEWEDEFNVGLTWDDWSDEFNTSSSHDYDLYLYKIDRLDGSISEVARSANFQPPAAPFEEIAHVAGFLYDYALAIRKWPSADPLDLRLLVLSQPQHKIDSAFAATSSTIIPPSGAKGAISVGAMSYRQWDNNTIQPFSSRGPTADGRTKPDIVGPDEVSTYSMDFAFRGTSAAAPHVAGVAALIKSVNPQYTRDQLADALFAAATDIGEAGKDNTFGWGKLELPQPATRLAFSQVPASTVSGDIIPAITVVAWNDAGDVDANFNETLTISLDDGAGTLAGTFSVSATSGVATFSDLTYVAVADGETFTLRVNDASARLSPLVSEGIEADVVATQLVFTTQPDGSVSGSPLTTQPVVSVQDAHGLVDTDFASDVTLSLDSGAGYLSGTVEVAAMSGVASYSDVTYFAIADGEAVSLQAVGGGLPAVSSDVFIAEVLVSQLVFTYDLPSGWSMVSLPLEPDDRSLAALFPTAISAFGFDGSYEQVQNLDAGSGYWLNLENPSSSVVSGLPVRELESDLPQGWSMVGAPWGGAATIGQDPAGILISAWGYSEGYYQAWSLAAGEGYWVNLADSGRLSLMGDTEAGKPVTAAGSAGSPVPGADAVLWVTALDLRQALSLGVPQEAVVALPPRPPAGLFDVRLQLDGVEAWQAPHAATVREYPVLAQGEALNFHWTEPTSAARPWELVINDQSLALTGEGSVSVDAMRDRVMLRSPGTSLPHTLALKQNHPNPFNSRTVIGYELAEPADITLTIYNLLGQPVRTLVQNAQPAGVHQVEWDGRDDQGHRAASGVHMYRLTVGEHCIVRRMVMLR